MATNSDLALVAWLCMKLEEMRLHEARYHQPHELHDELYAIRGEIEAAINADGK